ncbi:Uncharacterised protein [Vibrio cholerae]|nr:Uncharacterised protein [Vibrio cholerae]
MIASHNADFLQISILTQFLKNTNDNDSHIC